MKIYSILCLLISSNAFALEIQSKKQNTDRQMYIINPTAQIQKVKYQLGVNAAYSKDPLISKGVITQNEVPLITDVSTLDISAAYRLNQSFQIGFLSTLHQVTSNTGTKTSYIDSFMFEAKYNFFKNFALSPFYMTASNTDVKIINGSHVDTLKLGQPGGSYGLKFIYDIPHLKQNNLSFFVIAKKSMQEDVYMNIDQSLTFTAGVSATIKITRDFDWKNELYAEYTKNNFPLEVLSYFSLKNNEYQIQAGIGSGNLQMSGANKYKAFAGITFLFDENLNVLKANEPKYDRSNFSQEKSKALQEDSDVEEQSLPNVSKPSAMFVYENSRSIASVDQGILKTLPNGQKVRVFEKEITKMPTEIGIVYISKKEYSKLVKEYKKKAKFIKPESPKFIAVGQSVLVEESPKPEEKKEVKVVESDVVDDSDPVNNIILAVTQEIVQPAKPEAVVISFDQIDAYNKDVVVVKKEEATNYVMEDLRTKVEKENALIEEMMRSKVLVETQKKQEIKKQEMIQDVIVREEEIIKENALIERPNYKEASNKNDYSTMKNVKINSTTLEKDMIIKVPKVEISQEEKKVMAEKTLNSPKEEDEKEKPEPVYFDDTNLLNETNEMEEANSPIF